MPMSLKHHRQHYFFSTVPLTGKFTSESVIIFLLLYFQDSNYFMSTFQFYQFSHECCFFFNSLQADIVITKMTLCVQCTSC